MMNSKMWVWVGLGALLVVLVAANLSILTAFPPGQQHAQEPLKRVNWILPFGTGFEYRGPYGSPVIVYDRENGTWRMQDGAVWNRALFLGDRCSDDPSHPEDIWYTPDITVEGDRLSLDVLVWNGAGEDCARADLTMTTGIESLNTATGSLEGPASSSVPAAVPGGDLAAGDWREVRVTADLPRPEPEEVLFLTITLIAPYTFTTPDGTTLTFELHRVTVIESSSVSSGGDQIGTDRDYNRARLPRASATFVVQGMDAPALIPPPTVTAG